MEEKLINWFSCSVNCGLYIATTQLQQTSSSYYWQCHCAVSKLAPKCLRNQQWKRIQRFMHLVMLNWSDQRILNIKSSKESKKILRIHSKVIQTENKRKCITMLNKIKPLVGCKSSSRQNRKCCIVQLLALKVAFSMRSETVTSNI